MSRPKTRSAALKEQTPTLCAPCKTKANKKMDSATKADLESFSENFSDILKQSFESLVDKLNTQHSKQQHDVDALQETLEGQTTHPKGHPGSFRAPIFRGEGDDPLAFLEQYQMYSKFFGWTESQTYHAFPLSLVGTAQIWFSTLDKEQCDTLEHMMEKFRDRFLNPSQNWMLRQKLLKRRQASTESVSDFAADIRKQAQRLAIPEQEQLHYFVQGLKPELRSHVILQQPENFEQAEQQAKIKSSVGESQGNNEVLAAIQRLISLQEKQIAPAPLAAYSEQNRGENRREPRSDNSDIRRIIQEEIRAERGQSRPFNDNNRRPLYNNRGDFGRGLRTTTGQIICNRCGRVGHFARACYQQQRNDPRIPRPPINTPTFAVRTNRFPNRPAPRAQTHNQSN